MLLAYDGSPKAEEALFVATYQANRWGRALTVLTVETTHTESHALAKAKKYLESHDVKASYVLEKGHIGEAVLGTASVVGATLIIMGGFGASPALRLLQGSTVEYVLQHVADQVVLICQ